MRALLRATARACALRGKPTFWAPRGRLQLVADRVQAAGAGALLEALEQLKAKLAAEGLFAPERKRPLPHEPRVVGVVTSPTGAVIHDVVPGRVPARRRAHPPRAGAGAGRGRGRVDLPRARGSSSACARWTSSSSGAAAARPTISPRSTRRRVVRAVAACRVPVVSAVGHEVDVTLVDFAADARAATPSQAAEMVVPDRRARAELLRRTRVHLVARDARRASPRTASRSARAAQSSAIRASPSRRTSRRSTTASARLAAWSRARAWRGGASASRGAAAARVRSHPQAVVARERAELSQLGDRLARRAAMRAHARAARRARSQRATGRPRRAQPAQGARARLRDRDARGRPRASARRPTCAPASASTCACATRASRRACVERRAARSARRAP